MLDAIASALEGSALDGPRLALSHTLSKGSPGLRPCIGGPVQPDLLRQIYTVLLHAAIKREFPVQVWPKRLKATLVAHIHAEDCQVWLCKHIQEVR